jgi:ribosome recycling factor
MNDELVQAVLEDATEKMDKAVHHAIAEFSSIRTGRATPAFVEKLPVEYYGSEVPLQQIAGFSVPEARTLVIQPYDANSIKAIEKAIQHSDLGLNPSNDGKVIRLSFPPLTAERRKEYVRMAKNMAEEGRTSVRNVRRAARQDLGGLKNDGDLSEDELERVEKDLDKLTAQHVSAIDTALETKEHELLGD